MKLLARAVTALALLGLATPALPCGDMGQKEKTATSSTKKSTVAKSGGAEKKGATPTKSGEAKPASATN